MRTRKHFWAERKSGAIFFLLLGTLLLVGYVALQSALPKENEFVEVKGKLLWFKATKRSFYFGMATDPSQFVIDSKGDWGGDLENAIRNSLGQELTIKYMIGEPRQPLFQNGTYYPVGGIKIAEKDARPFRDFVDSYQCDNFFALVIGAALSLYGAWRLLWLARRGDG